MNDAHPMAENWSEFVRYCADMLSRLPEDKQEHFRYLLEALINCYLTEQSRALVLVSDSPAEQTHISLIAVNADEAETSELIDTLCVFRKLDFNEKMTVN